MVSIMPGMPAHSGALYTAEQVRDLDRRAIDEFGIPGYQLMTRAGHATLDALRALWPATKSIAVLCGPGNNGGDGYVVARVARAQGLRTEVFCLDDPRQLRGDARQAHVDFVAAGGHCRPWRSEPLDVDVIVDALFGTGLTREISGDAAELLRAANAAQRPIVAVDIPSGLHADSGAVLGVAARAALTVTFIGRKLGFYLGEGPEHVGRLVCDDLGVPPQTYSIVTASASLLGESDVAAALPRRGRSVHKGSHGHVLVIGGGPGMPGAARLAGEAALRAGAGLVTVAVHPDNVGIVAERPELMCTAARSARDLATVLARATVVAIGPGLGTDVWGRGQLEAALGSGLPLIVDADALNLIAERPRASDHWVLTPHPGEAARLLGSTGRAVQADRLAAARQLQARYGGHVVLKGAGSIVQSPGDVPRICDRGNPGMAAGGMGDVLTGVIAGIAAQCGDLARAARAGVFVHAQAGDLAARRGERGLLASDLLDQLRSCVNPC
ncbi:MAG: ADP-dependent NAD(P)H-hydrate dehydratase / NAD(P)H-hydrate epimerase [Pseudomonadota bacterium]|nr:ADP-dependent NAD(P)H-hydrate dehydratase / NAD(P)H-hydrate epimerase [Pseudomonadota bacterium]